MPLTQRVTYKTTLQKNQRLRIPKIVRSRYKLETSDTLRVTISVVGLVGVRKNFLAKMRKDGCINVPSVVLALLKKEQPNIEKYAIEVMLQPA